MCFDLFAFAGCVLFALKLVGCLTFRFVCLVWYLSFGLGSLGLSFSVWFRCGFGVGCLM